MVVPLSLAGLHLALTRYDLPPNCQPDGISQHFTVHWTDSKALSDIVGSVTVDGKSTSDTSISYKGKPNVEMTAEGFRVSEDAIRPFLFNRIKFKGFSVLLFVTSAES